MLPKITKAVTFTTDGSGNAAIDLDAICGRVLEIKHTYVDAATGADLVITSGTDNQTTAQTILTITNVGTSSISWRPRQTAQDNVGADVTFDGTNEIYDYFWVADEQIHIVVSNGGDTKTGSFQVIYG